MKNKNKSTLIIIIILALLVSNLSIFAETIDQKRVSVSWESTYDGRKLGGSEEKIVLIGEADETIIIREDKIFENKNQGGISGFILDDRNMNEEDIQNNLRRNSNREFYLSITKLNEKFNKDNNSGIVSTTDDEDIDNKSIEFQLNHNKISEEVLIILDRDVIFKNPNYYVDLSKNLGEYNKKNETLESIFGVRDHSTTMTKYKLEDINATQENLDSILFNQIYNNI